MPALAAILALCLGVLLPAAPANAGEPAAPLSSVVQAVPGAGLEPRPPGPADQAGVYLAGWVDRGDGAPEYYNPVTHRPHEGWLSLGGVHYYIDPGTHRAHIGWLVQGRSRFLMGDGDSSAPGAMLSGCWVDLGGERYHLSATGAADVGWTTIDGVTWCFGGDGRLLHGWVRGQDGRRRWIDEDGAMAVDEMVPVDGVYQAFGPDGAWVTVEGALPPGDAANVAAMTARQHAVVVACDAVPWPGPNLCAGWVSSVFSRAGQGGVGGNACDLARAWCTSDDPADLRPGMLIAVTSHPHTEPGAAFGHVGIYVGGGIVRDSSRTGLRHVALGSWIAWYGATEPVRWGWANGVDLSAS